MTRIASSGFYRDMRKCSQPAQGPGAYLNSHCRVRGNPKRHQADFGLTKISDPIRYQVVSFIPSEYYSKLD
ncbi:hypothetical protein ACN38_g6931 [Penicillium nordicum]|uniref:Uncharacterized protein n=1 Tax=Penicillium nordicum TaxID=229535 RepID=A0A0M9WEX6_9EURO|nr:hypothetical protein ACN38_g6931 [Penicillium nordicum]